MVKMIIIFVIKSQKNNSKFKLFKYKNEYKVISTFNFLILIHQFSIVSLYELDIHVNNLENWLLTIVVSVQGEVSCAFLLHENIEIIRIGHYEAKQIIDQIIDQIDQIDQID